MEIVVLFIVTGALVITGDVLGAAGVRGRAGPVRASRAPRAPGGGTG